ncbi:MAG: prolipoprotein diacylglyceryl transferase [Rikenellaceae bacterium]
MISFIDWNVDPVIFSIGSYDLLYYSLSWAIAFILAMWVFSKMLKREKLNPKLLDSAFMYAFISTVVGARLGHCLFYEFDTYIADPIRILNIREGGLASHGAAFGLLLGLWLFSKKNKMKYIWTLDHIVTLIPLSGACIRIGNLMNSEIYGNPTGSDFGFRFIENIWQWKAGAEPIYSLPSHPTQIYEAAIYIALFAVLLYMYYKDATIKYPGLIFGVFLIWLFGGRLIIEFIKLPQVSFESMMTLNMGQILSVPFIILGIVIMNLSLRKKL